MRRIGVVTVARSDYGIYRPILRLIEQAPDLELVLIAAAAHLSREFGHGVDAIEVDGFRVAERVAMLRSSDEPAGIAASMGAGTAAFGEVLARVRPDVLLVQGDRFEMHAAALAALPFKIPVAHMHGGEVTEGAIDDALRHSMTKLSHLHFVATEAYARRVRQLGEEPWRVTVSGAPALDNLAAQRLFTPDELRIDHGITVDRRTLLVTYHPVTLEYEDTEWQVGELVAALADVALPAVITAPNADTRWRTVRRMLQDFAGTRADVTFVETLGTPAYFSAMALAGAMVGNSSSGIVEAATFHLPVVNIGTRQAGRVRADNVIDVGYERDGVAKAIRTAVSAEFRARIAALENPYGKSGAAEIIVNRLREVPLDARLTRKRFIDGSG
jgi:UDP-hydrolysing UDP-N-acetyl-D-glucosamine 2-epimerase